VFHRRLEHHSWEGSAYFVTWMLHGALPVARAEFLDGGSSGPLWLERHDVAQAVADILLKGESDGHYDLGAWVVMPNHAHILVRPAHALGRSMAAIKGSSAHAANQLLHRKGMPFWAKDYFDRRLRDSDEEHRLIHYIEWNPVKAGLCTTPEEWRWSSARTRLKSRVP